MGGVGGGGGGGGGGSGGCGGGCGGSHGVVTVVAAGEEGRSSSNRNVEGYIATKLEEA